MELFWLYAMFSVGVGVALYGIGLIEDIGVLMSKTKPAIWKGWNYKSPIVIGLAVLLAIPIINIPVVFYIMYCWIITP